MDVTALDVGIFGKTKFDQTLLNIVFSWFGLLGSIFIFGTTNIIK